MDNAWSGIKLPKFEDPEIMKRRRMLKTLGLYPEDYDGAGVADMDEMIRNNQPADVEKRRKYIEQNWPSHMVKEGKLK